LGSDEHGEIPRKTRRLASLDEVQQEQALSGHFGKGLRHGE